MSFDPSQKYRPFPPIDLPNRQWPSRSLEHSPIWCSVDLRDGNQALAVPMNVSQKLEMFDALVKCGFKQIEVGFPSASNTEYEFNRRLIEDGRIPHDVTIQCLVQAREDLIEKTVQSLMGAKNVIIHMYNSTSPAQRKYVFGLEKADIVNMAVRGAKWVKERISRLEENGTRVTLQYSPESFSLTELEFAKEISEAVMDVWQPTPQRKMILNLPDTVQVAMPNVYADQIEWMCSHIKNRDSLIISLHAHNDRGTGTAATELAMLAGADRVEGTLFGNGERTGNLDIVQVAMNLYMHGIDPKLDFSDMNGLIKMYERCTGMTVPARQPYAGELVFTAFSGSHQDAINKGMALWKMVNGEVTWTVVGNDARITGLDGVIPWLMDERNWETPAHWGAITYLFVYLIEAPIEAHVKQEIIALNASLLAPVFDPSEATGQIALDLKSRICALLQYLQKRYEGPWDVPYLTIDPKDIGREYHEVIRVNSQSGKGGVAYLLEAEFGIELPKDLQREFGPIANDAVDKLGREVTAAELKAMFWKEYIERNQPYSLIHFHADGVGGLFSCRSSMEHNAQEIRITGEGNGPIAAFVDALKNNGAPAFEITTYREQSLSEGTGASALSYIQIKRADGRTFWGAGVDTNIELASIKAVVSAVNRAV